MRLARGAEPTVASKSCFCSVTERRNIARHICLFIFISENPGTITVALKWFELQWLKCQSQHSTITFQASRCYVQCALIDIGRNRVRGIRPACVFMSCDGSESASNSLASFSPVFFHSWTLYPVRCTFRF